MRARAEREKSTYYCCCLRLLVHEEKLLRSHMYMLLISYYIAGLIAAEGERWREQRKFVASSIKNFGMVKFESPKRDKMEERILNAVNEALEKFESRQTKDGVNTHNILHHCIGNLMNLLTFGRVYDENDELWKWLQYTQEEGVKHIGVSGPINFLPVFRFIPTFAKSIEFILDGQSKTHEVYRKILQVYRSNPTEINSFLAAFDEEMKRRIANNDDLGSFTDTQLVYLLADIYGAGVDTTLATIGWFLLFMAAYPDEQAKIQEEMDNILGENMPKLKHRPALIRLEAAIMEVQRIKSVVPTGIPHGTTEDTKIEDYDIPKGTMIIPVQWAVHMNPLYWPEPHTFKPERFIEKDGSLAKPDAFLPFQIGKRMCVGDEFARMILYLFGARILHQFSLSPPPGRTIDLETNSNGITLLPIPQKLCVKRRH
ncbi:cytochrome P450 306a1 isoform X2 [Phymastichus coffea]|uniref:cytochrome P450 306a1 isoform X2 n=1 Tax=Phymastichus coffea TaxID=108790 RepID=UPI00273CA98A|nr:cytochrome P450 306a1 isoform X2 [Phymastichus coffea]